MEEPRKENREERTEETGTREEGRGGFSFPLPVCESLQGALELAFGEEIQVLENKRLAGGDTASAFALLLSGGEQVFLKIREKSFLGTFAEEAHGLLALAETNTLLVPRVLGLGVEGEYSFLLLTFLENRSQGRNWETLGRGLAAMHRCHFPENSPFYLGDRFGFGEDNHIGRGEQRNTPHSSWVSFFAEERLLPQYEKAKDYLTGAERSCFERLLKRLPELIGEPAAPALLHGDLWAGNVLWLLESGEPVLIDPAVSFGHPEADLAMTELFGGFSPAFLAAYQEVSPLEPGFSERKHLYNLYHLLNHLNLFGEMYLPEVSRILTWYGRP